MPCYIVTRGTRATVGEILDLTQNIEYNAYSLPIQYSYTSGSNTYYDRYTYDDRGNRVKKESLTNTTLNHVEYQIHDASGNVVAIYTPQADGTTTQIEHMLYGSKRVASKTVNYTSNSTTVMPVHTFEYELADHLGNVRVKKNTQLKLTAGVYAEEDISLNYVADYESYGNIMYSWSLNGTSRYSYQGQYAEKDAGTGLMHFDLRDYNPFGRWLVPDPKGQHWSPYLAMGNNPVMGVDPDGGKAKIKYKENGKKYKGTYDKDKGAFFDKKGNQLKGEYVDGVIESINYLKKGDINGVIDFVATTKKVFTIKQTDKIGLERLRSGKWTYFNLNSGTKLFDNNKQLTGAKQSPALGLFHEMVHFYGIVKNYSEFHGRQLKTDKLYLDYEEMHVIDKFETPAAVILGEGIRTNHYGEPYYAPGPTKR